MKRDLTDKMNTLDRFLKYVGFYTTSDEESTSSPSTDRQNRLGEYLSKELADLGLTDIHTDSCGNVIATLPAKELTSAPVLGLIAHMDTAPDAPGENVRPRIVRYEGGELKLNDSVSLTPELCPGIEEYIGEEIVVTDGTTLLGADDKAGIAEIVSAVERLKESGDSHTELRIVFTTDEEVGRGAEGLDVNTLGCRYAYTVDGGRVNEIEYENFNAASAQIDIKGIGVHPGSAKGVMKNAALIASELVMSLPENERPENTELREGFYHVCDINGSMTEAHIHIIVRDHDRTLFENRKAFIKELTDRLNEKYGSGTLTLTLTDSYYNMSEKIQPHMHLIERAENALRECGTEPVCLPIRGGTDGAVLSWQGLPCPNLPTGGMNFHGVREYIPVKSLEIMTSALVKIIKSFNTENR